MTDDSRLRLMASARQGGQMTEDRGQRTDDRGQMTEGRTTSEVPSLIPYGVLTPQWNPPSEVHSVEFHEVNNSTSVK